MKDPGSFRDPSGYIVNKNGKVYRLINSVYKYHFDKLINSGLYDKLCDQGLLVKHTNVENSTIKGNHYKILEVEKVPFISYPYEWSFTQFKDALLLTLKIQKICIKYEMTLKDSTPFNIQFVDNKPLFIDTLSFESIKDGNYVWKPYKQFCEMFLGPLCLMKYVDPNLNKLLINHVNGIPLNLINKLLPLTKKFNLSILTHLVIPSFVKKDKINSNQKYSIKSKISKSQHLNILNHIENFVTKMNPPNFDSEWGGYNKETISEKESYVIDKEKTLKSFLINESYNLTWDIGSNDGYFSRIIAEKFSENVISFDIDWKCVDSNYLNCKSNKIKNVFPLLLDLSNPTPSIGWLNKERSSVYERFGSPDLICCFAVIHHIINVGIPLEVFVEFLLKSNKDVLIEYVPFSDPKCQLIFESRGSDFEYPSLELFKNVISEKFEILKSHKIKNTDRIIYHITKKL